MNKEQKYIARQAIFEALTGGRKLSQMDCREFEVEDMRTPISHMKDRFDNAGFNLHTMDSDSKGQKNQGVLADKEIPN